MADTDQVEDQDPEFNEVTEEVQEEVQTERVVVGDQEYDVPASVASYLTEQTRKLNDTEAALNYTKELNRPVAPQPAVVPQPKEPESFSVDDSEFFANPAATFARFSDHLASTIDQKLTGVREDYTQDQQRREYWNTFYQENPELKGYESIVDGTFASNKQAWADQPLSKSRTLLAEEARKTLLKIANKFDITGAKNGNTLVPSSSKTSSKVAPKKEEKLVSLSDEIRARQDRRRSASSTIS